MAEGRTDGGRGPTCHLLTSTGSVEHLRLHQWPQPLANAASVLPSGRRSRRRSVPPSPRAWLPANRSAHWQASMGCHMSPCAELDRSPGTVSQRHSHRDDPRAASLIRLRRHAHVRSMVINQRPHLRSRSGSRWSSGSGGGARRDLQPGCERPTPLTPSERVRHATSHGRCADRPVPARPRDTHGALPDHRAVGWGQR